MHLQPVFTPVVNSASLGVSGLRRASGGLMLCASEIYSPIFCLRSFDGYSPMGADKIWG